MKNSLVNPSGPDTLSLGRARNADLISSAGIGATSPAAEPDEDIKVNNSCNMGYESTSLP